MRIFITLSFVLALAPGNAFAQSENGESFLVCGDNHVLLVRYGQSLDTIPAVVWRWNAHEAQDLPQEYRRGKFNSIDDCKPVKRGKQLLVSSSSGAVAVVRMKDMKVLFYATVPNAHSVELLPRGRLAAAASTARDGNKVIVFKMRKPDLPLITDSLYSAHGLVWHRRGHSLFALGYDVLREYKLDPFNRLRLRREWRIPGEGGHDLQLSPDKRKLFVTEHHGCWEFDLKTHQFSKIAGFPDAANIKSLGQNRFGQYIYTVPEESWWTYHVRFSQPPRRVAFPAMKVYKARWMVK